MDSRGIQNLLRRLGCERVHVGAKWIKATCPLARWRHTKGTDTNPSFEIAIDDKGRSGWKCHSCTPEGRRPGEPSLNLINLINRLIVYNPSQVHKYRALAEVIQRTDLPSIEQMKARLAGVSSVPGPPREVAGVVVSEGFAKRGDGDFIELPALPEDLLEKFQPLSEEAREYLEERGLSKATIQSWELGWHAGARRVSIPVRDIKGRLVGISGRALDSDQYPKFLHSNAFHRDFYLFGEHRCQTPEVAYLVEGFFDAISLWQRGYRFPLCFMGSGISRFQVEKLVQLGFKEAVIVPDGDPPGVKIADGVLRSVSARMPTRVIPMPDGADPDDLTRDELLELLGPPQEA